MVFLIFGANAEAAVQAVQSVADEKKYALRNDTYLVDIEAANAAEATKALLGDEEIEVNIVVPAEISGHWKQGEQLFLEQIGNVKT